MIAVILNGPPSSGKDTICVMAAEMWGFASLEFKDPIYEIAATTLGMTKQDFLAKYKDREWKETKRQEWGNRSVRDLMISISEDYIKPFFGKEYFGNKVVKTMESMAPFVRDYIFSDGGFYSETDALIKAGVDVYIVHLYREGCSFEGDSRDYVYHPDATTIELQNNGTLEETLETLTRMLKDYGLPIEYTGDGNSL